MEVDVPSESAEAFVYPSAHDMRYVVKKRRRGAGAAVAAATEEDEIDQENHAPPPPPPAHPPTAVSHEVRRLSALPVKQNGRPASPGSARTSTDSGLSASL